MAIPIGARLGVFETNEGADVWPRSVWVGLDVYDKLMARVRVLEGLPPQAAKAKTSLRSFLRASVGGKWADEDDKWLYKVLGDFVDWESGIRYLRTVFE